MIEYEDSVIIPAARAAVYAALNDAEILANCIPGCETVQRVTDTNLCANITLKFGFVRASFSGDLEIRDLQPPDSYTLHFSGRGKHSSQANGTAKMKLSSHTPDSTLVHYDVSASIDGRVAKLGQKLITSSAQSITKRFFNNLCDYFSQGTCRSKNDIR